MDVKEIHLLNPVSSFHKIDEIQIQDTRVVQLKE